MTHKLFDARLTLLSTDEGGKSRPIASGYRSLFRFSSGENFGVELTMPEPIAPGGTGDVSARIWVGDLLADLASGDAVELYEGPHLVARGQVLTPPTRDI